MVLVSVLLLASSELIFGVNILVLIVILLCLYVFGHIGRLGMADIRRIYG